MRAGRKRTRSLATFGDRFRMVRSVGAMDWMDEDGVRHFARRQDIRDRMRAFQLRNDGSHKDQRPDPPTEPAE